jgi:hypothetical protein
MLVFEKRMIKEDGVDYLELILENKSIAKITSTLIVELCLIHGIKPSIICFDQMAKPIIDNPLVKDEIRYFELESNYFEVMDDV